MAPSTSPQRPSVLFAHPSDEAYGADRVFLTTVMAAVADGRVVRVLLPDDTAPGWLSERLNAMGVLVKRGPLAPARRRYLRIRALPAYAMSLLRAARFMRQEALALGAAVIYVNTSSLLVAAFVGRPGRAHLVWHIHELVMRPRFAAWIFRFAPVVGADCVIAISDAVRAHLTPAGLGKRKVVRIYNGIDAAKYRLLADRAIGHPRIAFVGRLNRWKGYEVFLRAASQVAAEFPTARFQFFGAPPPGEEWRAIALVADIQRLGLAACTDVFGFQSDMPTVLGSIDIVVAPSLWPEPFGLALLEAMSAGCAVVGSDSGATPELVDNGRSGLLVAPGDVDALAHALRILLQDPDFRQRLGTHARERAESFSESTFVSEVQRILRKLDHATLPSTRSVTT